MSDDKKYRLKVNLSANRKTIRKGTVYDSAKDTVPGVILNEVKLGTGTVEVLSAESVPQPSEQIEVKDKQTAAEIKIEELVVVRAKAEVEAKAIDDNEAELRKTIDDAKKEKEEENEKQLDDATKDGTEVGEALKEKIQAEVDEKEKVDKEEEEPEKSKLATRKKTNQFKPRKN